MQAGYVEFNIQCKNNFLHSIGFQHTKFHREFVIATCHVAQQRNNEKRHRLCGTVNAVLAICSVDNPADNCCFCKWMFASCKTCERDSVHSTTSSAKVFNWTIFLIVFLVFSNVCGSAFIVGLFVLSVPNTNRLYLKLYAEFYFDIIVLQFHFINLAQASVIL